MRSRGTILGVIVVLAGGCSGEADIIVDAPTSTIAPPGSAPTAAETTSGTPATDTATAPGDFETDRGNTLRIAGSGFLLDQAAAYDADSWFLLRGLIRQLVTTVGPGADGRERLVADLATDTGSANTDYTEWTFTLREGVAFGPGTGGDAVEGATGRPITAVDLKYAIERLFAPSVFAAYGFYYESLRGAKGFAECVAREGTVAACNGIPGITTSGDREITFTLAEPVPDWPARLALPAAAPVPVDVATAADAGAVSGYSALGISTGPYVILREEPGEWLEVGRNETWDPATDDVREANVDGLVALLTLSPEEAVQAVRAGQADLALGGSPTNDLLEDVPEELVVSGTASCLDYLYLDTRVPPFDDRAVREAVNRALPRAAIGPTGPSSTIAPSILPPGVPGHRPAVAFDPFGVGEGSGDIAAGQAALAAAGFPDGFPGTLIVRAQAGDETSADVVATTLAELGFDDVVPFAASAGVDLSGEDGELLASLGFNFWCWDYQDAVTFFEPLLASQTSGLDYAHFENADLDGSIATAARLAGPEREEAWGSVNERATEAAMWVPLAWRAPVTVRSARWNNPVYNAAIATLDWTVAELRD